MGFFHCVGCTFSLKRRGVCGWVGWVEIFWVCSCHFSLGASIQCPWHLSVTKKFLQGDKTRGQELWFKGSASIIHFVVDSISLRTDPNMIYCQICSFQPMEIYVDDEAKLTLHGLVQVGLFKLFAYIFFF
jgi:hypothetical protein